MLIAFIKIKQIIIKFDPYMENNHETPQNAFSQERCLLHHPVYTLYYSHNDGFNIASNLPFYLIPPSPLSLSSYFSILFLLIHPLFVPFPPPFDPLSPSFFISLLLFISPLYLSLSPFLVFYLLNSLPPSLLTLLPLLLYLPSLSPLSSLP